MGKFRDLFARTPWLAVENTTAEEIPAFALLRVTGVATTGGITVAKPNADSLAACLVNSEGIIPANGRGLATHKTPAFALYDAADGAPAAGEAWGAGNASWKLRKGKAGFRIVGGATAGRVLVTRDASCCNAPNPPGTHCCPGATFPNTLTLTIGGTRCPNLSSLTVTLTWAAAKGAWVGSVQNTVNLRYLVIGFYCCSAADSFPFPDPPGKCQGFRLSVGCADWDHTGFFPPLQFCADAPAFNFMHAKVTCTCSPVFAEFEGYDTAIDDCCTAGAAITFTVTE